MINKKNLLGKRPFDLGDKDAVHVAIVAVRAAELIKPGQRCTLNEHREGVPHENGIGVADPFLKKNIERGQPFWFLLDGDEVPNVRHVWEHPTADFSAPTREIERNRYIQRYADEFGVSYQDVLDACAFVVQHDEPAKYPGSKSAQEVDAANGDLYDLWSSWSEESGHEFYNRGTECCPEYEYPERGLFKVKEKLAG